MKKLCLIYNTAPHYRDAIFRAIDRELDCDWYFGKTTTDIKEMEVSLLKNVFYYKTRGNLNKLFWQGALIPCLFKKKYKNFFILTQVRSVSFWIFTLLRILFFPNKKVYGWSHGWYGREGRLQKQLDRWRINHSAGQFVYNQRARRLMIEGGINPDKVFVIGNSLDYDTQFALRKQLRSTDIFTNHFGNDNPVIVFIGRLTLVKRLDMIINAVNILKNRRPINVVFIGDGQDKAHLMQLTKDKGLEQQIWFYGASYDEEQNAELIYNATLCVSPGNVGLTAMHTMMFGTPVITNDDFCHQMPEFEAIEAGVTGAFFKTGDTESLAKCISEWISEHPNRESVREACYKEIDERWNPYFQMDQIRKHLKI